jgi:hypothetical protein
VGIKKDGVLNHTATDLDFSGAGTAITSDGSTTLFNLVLAGPTDGGYTSQTSLTTAVSTSYMLVNKVITTNGDAAFTQGTLANGLPGQFFTIAVVGTSPGNGTGSFTITPTTKSGFTSITMTAINDRITFFYINDTYGWAIVSYQGSITLTR